MVHVMENNKGVSVATGIGKHNPGSFLKGLCGSSNALARADYCPAKGQPLQESFGVFLWPLSGLHSIARAFMGCVEANRRASLPIPGLVIRGATPILCDGWILKDTPGVKRKAARCPTAKVIKATSYFFLGVGGGFAVILGNTAL